MIVLEPDLASAPAVVELSLRAERKSPQTVKSYGDGVRRFIGWAANGVPAVLDRKTLSVRRWAARWGSRAVDGPLSSTRGAPFFGVAFEEGEVTEDR